MPILRPCAERGCEEEVQRGRCPKHQKARDQAHNRLHHRWVYRDKRWHACRWRAFEREDFRCQVVEGGERCPVRDRTGAKLHGHHDYPGGVRQMLADGVSPFDDRRVVVCCETHHQQIEAWLRARRR